MNLIFKHIKQIKHSSVCHSGPVLEPSGDRPLMASKPLFWCGWLKSSARHLFSEMETQIIIATEYLDGLRTGRIPFSDPTSQTLHFVFEIEIHMFMPTKYLDDLKIKIITFLIQCHVYANLSKIFFFTSVLAKVWHRMFFVVGFHFFPETCIVDHVGLKFPEFHLPLPPECWS